MLEKLANAAVAILAVVLTVVLVRDFLLPRRRPAASPSAAVAGEPLHALRFPESHAKAKIVLALSAKCGFCERSVPFYRAIDRVRRQSNGELELYAVFAEDATEASQKLNQWGLKPDKVFPGALASNGFNGTPVLVLINDRNLIVAAWQGQLGPDRENEVVQQLSRLCKACQLLAVN